MIPTHLPTQPSLCLCFAFACPEVYTQMRSASNHSSRHRMLKTPSSTPTALRERTNGAGKSKLETRNSKLEKKKSPPFPAGIRRTRATPHFNVSPSDVGHSA